MSINNLHKLYKFFRKPELIIFSVIAIICFAISISLSHSLFQELTTPNYGYHGTHNDFLAFYAAGKSTINGSINEVYDQSHIAGIQRQIIYLPKSGDGYLPFLNPPFVAVFLAPLSLFDINVARLIWLFLSLLMASYVILKLTHPLHFRSRLLAFCLLISTFPMYETFVYGQLSILVLFGGCLSFVYFKKGKKVLSGASLALFWILPQIGLVTALGLLVKREWKMLKGMLLSTAAIGLATLPITGINIYPEYVKMLAKVTGDHFINQQTTKKLTWYGPHEGFSGLNGFFESLLGPNHTSLVNFLYFIFSAILVLILVWVSYKHNKKRTALQNAYMYASAVLIVCLTDPHLYAQDVILAYLVLPALFIIYKQHSLKAIILFSVFCNLVLLDKSIRIHLFSLTALILAIIYANKSIKSPLSERRTLKVPAE